MAEIVQLSNGTSLKVAPIPRGQTSAPPDITLTLATGGASAADVTIEFTNTLTLDLGGTSEKPAYINFVEPTGIEHLVGLTSPIVGNTVGVVALTDDIAQASLGSIYSELGGRESASIEFEPSSEDVTLLSNDGWGFSVPTSKAFSISTSGPIAPLNAGYQNCLAANLKTNQTPPVYVKLTLPPPSDFTEGQIFEIAAYPEVSGIQIEGAAIMRNDINLRGIGKPTITDPA